MLALPLYGGEGEADNRSVSTEPSATAVNESGFSELNHLNPSHQLIAEFYRTRGNALVWYQDGTLNTLGERLIEHVKMAVSQGLVLDDYHHLQVEILSSPEASDKLDLHMRELLLTDSFCHLANDLYLGHFRPADFDSEWHFPAQSFDPLEVLQGVKSVDDLDRLFAGLVSQSPDYRRLLQALAHYREIERQGGWSKMELDSILRPGMSNPNLGQLRDYLRLVGDLTEQDKASPETYSSELVTAVKRFQRRNGLADDGMLGPLTLVELNVPVAERIRQLRINLERWRWLPKNLGTRYLLVNTPGFDLKMVVDDESVFYEQTIIGRKTRQTPSFSSEITHVVINPDWTVPRTIAVEDMLPKLKKDPAYLSQSGIKLYREQGLQRNLIDPLTIDWSQFNVNNFPFTLRQPPGEKNSLGLIKFHMFNPFAVFLHDTPAKSLFDEEVRAFSSGCVRVQHADRLAKLLLENANQNTDEQLESYLKSGVTHYEKLRSAIPVYLVYFTSWVDPDGTVHFRPDIYGRNQKMLTSMQHERGMLTASTH